MIQKYTKKPVTIEAIQWTKENLPIIKEWLGENLAQLSSEERYKNPEHHWVIRDYLEGDMKITEGDFIIRGVKGEFYPCKPDIFYATYNGPHHRRIRPRILKPRNMIPLPKRKLKS
jgi:hypothetical protein